MKQQQCDPCKSSSMVLVKQGRAILPCSVGASSCQVSRDISWSCMLHAQIKPEVSLEVSSLFSKAVFAGLMINTCRNARIVQRRRPCWSSPDTRSSILQAIQVFSGARYSDCCPADTAVSKVLQQHKRPCSAELRCMLHRCQAHFMSGFCHFL